MAEDHRFLQPHGTKATMVEIMQVRSTDAASLDPYDDLSRAEGAGLTFLHTQIFGSMNDNCAHDGLSDDRGEEGVAGKMGRKVVANELAHRLPGLHRATAMMG